MNYFAGFVGSHDVVNGKPAPDVFLKAAEIIAAKPEECFIFEDSANGIIAGHTAGMKCIGVPDMVKFSQKIKSIMFAELNDLSEAIPILEKYL
jgi:beta-phosphoglucomutase-like phosphatase (HAD superfamily)